MNNAMETNPYAPPKAPVADAVSHRLKRRSVLLVITFLIVTLGLYYPIWFLRRRAALNGLDSQKKLQLWPFVIYGVALTWSAEQPPVCEKHPGGPPKR